MLKAVATWSIIILIFIMYASAQKRDMNYAYSAKISFSKAHDKLVDDNWRKILSHLKKKDSNGKESSDSVTKLFDLRGGDNGIASPVAENEKPTVDAAASTTIRSENKKRKSKKKRSSHTATNSLKKEGNHEDASGSQERKASKKKKKSSRKKGGKKMMNDSLRESEDIGKILGDAIRDRKDILVKEIDSIDSSLLSLGVSLGASDFSLQENAKNMEDGGGVEASRTSILANYFLQSNGGAYSFQCVASTFCVISGFASLYLPQTNPLALTLLRRSFLCALAKHSFGLITATILSARRIPEIGLYKTRKIMDELVRDSVAQYMFYCALLLFWLPLPNIPVTTQPWYLTQTKNPKLPLLCMLSPTLLRETFHLAWVVHDISVILGIESTEDSSSFIIGFTKQVLGFLGLLFDSTMSVLLTPKVWKNADDMNKQRHLAKLTSKISLFVEILTGVYIGIDATRAFLSISLGPVETRIKLLDFFRLTFCAYLYFNLMMVRKSKIIDLVSTIRGGAGSVPIRILDTLLEPEKALGWKDSTCANARSNVVKGAFEAQSWLRGVGNVLGL